MTDINKVIDEMPSEVYERLLSAVELGKWEDGTVLSQEQRASTQQVVMLYQARKLSQTEHFTINSEGQVNELSKSELKKQFKGDSIAEFKEKEL
ncbi:YeaC family protein [Shewanella sp. 10N.286.54.B9]|uniref:YeaC family protein n=1 Tax=Shewanella sp. 10N.286.54.B9 TaxID=3229719 RepID=UPI0035533569